ncbi:MAG: CocE/NonD family hydrolase [Desulfobacteraceae bacterium]
MAQSVIIKAGKIRLEGRIEYNSRKKAVVVTHPHPLYGGNMDNTVVITVLKCFAGQGFTTLRFNFRGTGKSTGTYDNGLGEQKDVKAAIDFLKTQDFEHVFLAGYSFGAWVNAEAVSSGAQAADHIMVSPPMAFLSFDDIETMEKTGFIVTGENDEIAPPDMIRACIQKWGVKTRFEILKGCDHFYSQGLHLLEEQISDYLMHSQG